MQRLKKQLFILSSFIMLLLCISAARAASLNQQRFLNEEWHGVYFKGAKLGFVHSRTEKKDDGYITHTISYIKTESFNTIQELSFSQESHMDKNFRSKHFTFIQEMMGRRQTIKGRMTGSEMEIETSSPDVTSNKKIRFTKNTFLSSDILFMVIQKGLQVGKTYHLTMLIEPLQTTVPVEISIIGKEKIPFQGSLVDTYVITEKMKVLSSTIWVTPEGHAIKEISFEGFEFKKEDRKTAIEFKNGVIPVSSLIAISLVSAESSIKNSSHVKHLAVTIELHDTSLLPEDHRQRVVTKKKTVLSMEIRSEKVSAREQHKPLPVDISDSPGLEKFLGKDHTIQSTHPDIIKKAKEIIGSETNSWLAVKRINTWVYTHMKKKPVDTFSALESLKTMEGECQSHTYLFTALARSVGIPAKVVNGVIYSPTYKGFLYHAWPEVYVGRWIAMDPTLGEEIADATHIKISEGDMIHQLDVLQFIGKVKITIDQ